jgi:hypothetical protein
MAAGRGGRMIRFQLLTCAVEIVTDDPSVCDALRYLVPDAEQSCETRARVRYEVMRGPDGGFSVLEDGRPIGGGLTPDGVMELIYTACHEAGYRSLPPHLRLHAGCATIAGRRVVVLGSKEAGKTTLMAQLLAEGVDVHCDELVLVTADGMALPFPRRFHVRPTSLPLIDGLADVAARSPRARTSEGDVVYSIAPTDFGRPWRITPAPIDALVFLRRNHGSHLPVEKAVNRLHSRVGFPERSVEWVAVLIELVNKTRNLVLKNSIPKESAAMLKAICEG